MAAHSEPADHPTPWTETRGRRIVRWVLATVGAQSVVSLLNLATGVISARVMGPDLKGMFNAVILWPGVFSNLTGMGLSAAFTSSYARAPREERRRLFIVASALAIGWGIVGAGLCAIVAPRLLGHLGAELRPWVLVASWVPVCTVWTYVCGSLLGVEERFDWLNWIRVSRPAAVVLGLLALALADRLTPYSQLVLVWSTAFLSSVPTLVLAVRAAARLPWGAVGVAVHRTAYRLSTLGFRYYAITLASTFNGQLDSMLATIWLSARQIGLYAVASSALTVVGMLSGAFATVFFPMSAADGPEVVVRRTMAALRRGLLLFLLVEVCLVALARPALYLMYGARYLGAWPAVLALAPEAVCIACLGVLYSGCYVLREFAIPSWGEVVGALTGLLFLVLFIPRWGIAGAGAAGSLSYALDLVTVLALWIRRHGLSWGALVPGRDDVAAVVRIAAEQARGLARRLGHVARRAWFPGLEGGG